MSSGVTSDAAAATNVLSAKSLATFMAASLPANVSPQLGTAYDAIALLSHSILLSVGFRIVGLGEDHRMDDPQASDSSLLLPPTNATQLPPQWKDNSPNFAFRYKHSQSAMEYLLKVTRMGSKAVIMAMALGHDKTTMFEVNVDDYVSQSSLPLDAVRASTDDRDVRIKSLVRLFITEGRIADFGANMRLNIIQKLLPSLQKEGYQETPSQTTTASSTTNTEPRPRPRPHPHPDPTFLPHAPDFRPPRLPTGDEFPPPDFEDPYDIHRALRPPLGGIGGPGFGNIGHRDLYPPGLGPNDPLRHNGPGLGRGGAGGMYPTIDDPLFRNQGRRGDDGFDLRAPPGARYDPVGPGDEIPRPMGGTTGARFPGRSAGGRPPNPFDSFGNDDFI